MARSKWMSYKQSNMSRTCYGEKKQNIVQLAAREPRIKLIKEFFCTKEFMMNNSHLVSSLPRELKEEIVKYCTQFAFVLQKTGLFLVNDETKEYSKTSLTIYAAEEGYFSLLKWAHRNKCPWSFYTCPRVAKRGHLDIIKWARENGCNVNFQTSQNEDICCYAAEGGQLHVLKWARENNLHWNYWTCCFAAKGGHLDVLQWLHENGCPGNEYTCAFAAEKGHLHVLQWLRETSRDSESGVITERCPWDDKTCIIASIYGHIHILEWAIANGCEWNRIQCLELAKTNLNWNIVQWIEQYKID